MLWAALFPIPPSQPSAPSPASAEPGAAAATKATAAATATTVQGLAKWCLQFTPRVAVLESTVVMELAASVRLFGGMRRLVSRVRQEAQDLGVGRVSWATSSLAAVALGRAGITNGFAQPIAQLLDALPLTSLTAVARHEAVLVRIGCRTLGDVRALPRGGISRRFDAGLLAALDEAYGLRPGVHDWVALPEAFCERLELMARVELAPALLFGARRLLLLMCGWLAARQCGVTAYTLRWCHDTMRSKSAGEGGELTIRTAEPTRDIEHLSRLLAEHLAKVQLLAAVGDLELVAVEVTPLEGKTISLLPDAAASGESLALVLERIAARLGPENVLQPVLREDHRPEWMCHWQPAPQPPPARRARRQVLPQPTFVLTEPLKLALRGNRPYYQGALLLLTGPHRIEGGWWHRVAETVDGVAGASASASAGAGAGLVSKNVARDYWVALSDHAGLLWVFQTRLAKPAERSGHAAKAEDETAWFLHGTFA